MAPITYTLNLIKLLFLLKFLHCKLKNQRTFKYVRKKWCLKDGHYTTMCIHYVTYILSFLDSGQL